MRFQMSRLKTPELFCYLMRDNDCRVPKIKERFPGKLLLLEDSKAKVPEDLMNECVGQPGMIYVIEYESEIKMACLLPHGTYIVTPSGDYKEQLGYYVIRNEDFRAVFEKTNEDVEAATIAEIDFRTGIESQCQDFYAALDAYLSSLQ